MPFVRTRDMPTCCGASALRHDTLSRSAPWPLRDPRAPRGGRDGRGVPGAGYTARADGGDQGAAVAHVSVARGPPAFRTRGEDDLAALASPYLRAVRRGTGGRDRIPGDGASRRRDAVGSAGEGAVAARADLA